MLYTPIRVCIRALPARQISRRWSSTKSKQAALEKFNILFCGSDSFSIAALKALYEAKDVRSSIHVISSVRPNAAPKSVSQAAVLLQPNLREYAQDRNMKMMEIPQQQGIDNWRLPKPFHELSESNVLVTASFGHILPDFFLHQFDPTRRLNLHPSLLPKYRGAAPIQWTIANGDTSTGVSVQRLVEKRKGIDGGEIVGSVNDIPVEADETYQTLLAKVATAGGNLLVEVLRQIQNGTDQAHPQDASQIIQAPKITHRKARILWKIQSASQIERLHRAIGHQEAVHTALSIPPAPAPQGGTADELSAVQLLEMRVGKFPGQPSEELQAGMGFFIKGGGTSRLLIACAPEQGEEELSWLEIMRVRKQSRKDMDIMDWWNGLPPRVRKGKHVQFS